MPDRPSIAGSPQVRARMQRVRRRDTTPELRLRRELHRAGFRYFVDRAPSPGLRRKADLVFPRARVAVFVDGCFWHGCPDHASWPKTNAEWWRRKIEQNVARDQCTAEELTRRGWAVLRIWAHEDPCLAALRVEALVRERLPRVGGS